MIKLPHFHPFEIRFTYTGGMASASSAGKGATEFLIYGKYRLLRKIGSGSFGDIYLGINITNGEVSGNKMFVYCIFASKVNFRLFVNPNRNF